MPTSLFTRPLAALLAVAAFACVPTPTQAAHSYDTCTGFIDSLPAIITTEGTWCLRQHLATAIASGVAVDIRSNNVTLDCNDFKIGGLAAGDGTQATGVNASSRTNVIVRNCGIRGFQNGIMVLGATAHGALIEHNRLDNNTFRGIVTTAPAAVIRHNRVFDTGGSTASNFARGIYLSGSGSEVLDNEVRGVFARAAGGGTAMGIQVLGTVDHTKLLGNRVSGVLDDGGSGRNGISTGERSIVSGNLVTQAQGSGTGIACAAANSAAHGNQVIGFATAVAGCTQP